MNEHAVAVDTPAGPTNNFELTEMVRQGSVYGSILFSSSTYKIKRIHKRIIEQTSSEVDLSACVCRQYLWGQEAKQTKDLRDNSCML